MTTKHVHTQAQAARGREGPKASACLILRICCVVTTQALSPLCAKTYRPPLVVLERWGFLLTLISAFLRGKEILGFWGWNAEFALLKPKFHSQERFSDHSGLPASVRLPLEAPPCILLWPPSSVMPVLFRIPSEASWQFIHKDEEALGLALEELRLGLFFFWSSAANVFSASRFPPQADCHVPFQVLFWPKGLVGPSLPSPHLGAWFSEQIPA